MRKAAAPADVRALDSNDIWLLPLAVEVAARQLCAAHNNACSKLLSRARSFSPQLLQHGSWTRGRPLSYHRACPALRFASLARHPAAQHACLFREAPQAHISEAK